MSSADLINPPAVKLAFLRDVDGVRLPLGEAASHSAAIPGVEDSVVFSSPAGARRYGHKVGKRTFHYDEDGNLAQVDLFVTVGRPASPRAARSNPKGGDPGRGG